MPNARLTHRNRRMRRARAEIEENVARATMRQFRWLWRELYPILRDLKARRNRRVKKLAKQYQLAGPNSLWDEFVRRLGTALQSEIDAGAVTLTQLEQGWIEDNDFDVPEIDPQAIVDAYRDQIGAREGREIKNIADSTRREMGTLIADWYRTPGTTFGQLIDSLKQWVNEARAAAIGSTETTALNSAVALNTMQSLGIRRWAWDTVKDELVCENYVDGPDGRGYQGCADLQGKIFTTDDTFPPDASHPNCRCAPIYVLDESI